MRRVRGNGVDPREREEEECGRGVGFRFGSGLAMYVPVPMWKEFKYRRARGPRAQVEF